MEHIEYQKQSRSQNFLQYFGLIVIIVAVSIGVSFLTTDNKSINAYEEGNNAAHRGDYTTAIENFEYMAQNAKNDEDKARGFISLGYTYMALNDIDTAKIALMSAKEIAETTPRDDLTGIASAELALLNNNPEEAQKQYMFAYDADPQNYEINNSMAIFYMDLEGRSTEYINDSQALIHAQKAFDAKDEYTHVTATFHLGLAHYFNENFTEAIQYLTQLQDPTAWYWTALAYYDSQDQAQADTFMQKALNAGIQPEPEILTLFNM